MSLRYLAAAGVLLASVATSSNAGASPAYATNYADLREGPGPQYSVIAVIPPGHPVEVIHCTFGYDWCEVAFLEYEGWVSGHYLRDDSYYVLYDFGPSLGIPVYEWTYLDLERRRGFRTRDRHRKDSRHHRRRLSRDVDGGRRRDGASVRREKSKDTVTRRRREASPGHRREKEKVLPRRGREYNARRHVTERARVNPRTIRRGEAHVREEKGARRSSYRDAPPDRRNFRSGYEREGRRGDDRIRETGRGGPDYGRGGPVNRRRF